MKKFSEDWYDANQEAFVDYVSTHHDEVIEKWWVLSEIEAMQERNGFHEFAHDVLSMGYMPPDTAEMVESAIDCEAIPVEIYEAFEAWWLKHSGEPA